MVIMDIVIDTSAIVAVIAGEPERNRIVELTSGNRLIGPGSIPWEVGNAFSAMLKQNRITLKEAHQSLAIFQDIPIRYVRIDHAQVLTLAQKTNMYAYDAYFMDCAIRHSAPLLTLDRKLLTAAKIFEIETLEV